MAKTKNPLTKTELKMIRKLRDKGYAVSIFTPEELDGAPLDDVEDKMVEAGWEAIEILKEEEDDSEEDD